MLFLTTLMAAALAGDAPILTPFNDRRWESVGTSNQDQVAIDPGTLSWQGRRVTLTVRLILGTPRSGNQGAVMRYTYDCDRRTAQQFETEIYDTSGGFVTREVPNPGQETEVQIAPGSPNELVLTRVCR